MKKLFLTFLIASLIFGACGSEEETNDTNQQETVPADVEIEEITSPVNNKEIKDEKPEIKPQLDADFRQFVDKFPHASLPYELKPDFEDEPENIYAKIPLETQVKYLAKAEKLSKADFEEMAEYTDYYYVSTPFHTDNFTAIIYGRFEMGSVYFYLCTYNNKGNLISSIDFASFNMLGAGPQAGQYTITKGKIDKNLNITVTFTDVDEYTSTEKYQIKEDGTIVKLS